METPPSGYFSSEFILGLISKIIAAAAIFGLFTPEQATELTKNVMTMGGVILAIATTLGYTWSRLSLKKKTLDVGLAKTESETAVSLARINKAS